MNPPTVFGAPFSVYVQAVRLTLAEKGVDHVLVDVNPFKKDGPGADHLQRQPFGLIPAFEDGAIRLYEAEAIARYVDDAYPGPRLMPGDPVGRARANQALSLLRAYAYPSWVRTLYIEQVAKPARGAPPDQAAIDDVTPRARLALTEIARLRRDAGGPFLAGATITLPDLFCAPMLACLEPTSVGQALLDGVPTMVEWWHLVQERDSVSTLVV